MTGRRRRFLMIENANRPYRAGGIRLSSMRAYRSIHLGRSIRAVLRGTELRNPKRGR